MLLKTLFLLPHLFCNVELISQHRIVIRDFNFVLPSSFCLSPRRLQDMSSRRLQDMFLRRLEHVFGVTIFRLPRHLQGILRAVNKKSSRRLGRRKTVTLKTC